MVMSSHEPPQDFQHSGDRFGQIEHFRHDGLLARERQQLAGQIRGPHGGILHFFELVVDRVVLRYGGKQHFRVPENDGEQIVEIVRDAAGKLPDGFKFLGLAQLGLQAIALLPGGLLFGDVLGDTGHGSHRARFVQQGKQHRGVGARLFPHGQRSSTKSGARRLNLLDPR